MNCPKCGYELSNEAKFCPNCGQKVFKKLFCRECGETLPDGAKFCEKCGAPVDLHDVLELDQNLEEQTKQGVVPAESEPIITDSKTEQSLKGSDNEPDEEDETEESDSFENVKQDNITTILPDNTISDQATSDNGPAIVSSDSEKTTNIKKRSTPSDSKYRKWLNKSKDQFIALWKRSDNFVRLLIVISFVLFFACFVSLLSGKFLNLLFSIGLFALTVVLLLIHRGEITVENKSLKKYLTIALVLLTLMNSCTAISKSNHKNSSSNNKKPSYNTTTTTPAKTTASIPLSNDECIGKKDTEIYNLFKKAGFTNVVYEEKNDLNIEDVDKVGLVENVSVDGTTEFEKDKEYSKNVQIVISNHQLKKVASPISSETAKTTDQEELKALFESVGWEVAEFEEVFDLDPDAIDSEFENMVSINEISDFDEATEFPINSVVKIIVHRPYEKHSLKVSIDFLHNLFFSTYDVKYKFNGETKLLEHGTDAEFEYSLKPGTYKLEFISDESSSVKGEVSLELNYDTEVEYQIHCTSEKVSVELVSLVREGAAGENEAMAPASDYDCRSENYKKVESWFKEAGFTNITTQPQYDIVWGLTSPESVASISIGGDEDFIKGDIFAKDSPVAIYYHMKEEDDPSKPKEEKNDNSTSSSSSSSSNSSSSSSSSTSSSSSSSNSSSSSSSPNYYSGTSDTVKNGNSGVYSYKKSGSYTQYYIIDFDAGYVYYFTEGNDSSTATKAKIASGDLNSSLEVSYRDGGDSWKEYLHFSWKNQPDHLVVHDAYDYTYDFYTTSLSSAKSLLNQKKIIDMS